MFPSHDLSLNTTPTTLDNKAIKASGSFAIKQELNRAIGILSNKMVQLNSSNRANLNRSLGIVESRISGNVKRQSLLLNNSINMMRSESRQHISLLKNSIRKEMDDLDKRNQARSNKQINILRGSFDRGISDLQKGITSGFKSAAKLELEGDRLIASGLDDIVKILKTNARMFPKQLEQALLASHGDSLDPFT